jgi:hypothetical protein
MAVTFSLGLLCFHLMYSFHYPKNIHKPSNVTFLHWNLELALHIDALKSHVKLTPSLGHTIFWNHKLLLNFKWLLLQCNTVLTTHIKIFNIKYKSAITTKCASLQYIKRTVLHYLLLLRVSSQPTLKRPCRFRGSHYNKIKSVPYHLCRISFISYLWTQLEIGLTDIWCSI